MRKLLVTLALAGTLSVPSAVFAEEEAGASWYGSLRGGIEFGGGDTKFYDGVSRWGIKGSAEASEGLTAVYRFEHAFSTTDGSQPNGRLGYVGLSGGFGTLTLGQIWSASYNHAGVIRDFPNWYTASDTSARVGNALSYSLSNDAFSMQIDAIMDGGTNTGSAVDQLEFGMTVNVGEIGKVALAHTNIKDQTVMVMPTIADWLGTFNPNKPTSVSQAGEENVPYKPGTDATPAMYMVDDDGDEATALEPTPRKAAMEIMVQLPANHPQLDTDGNLVAAHLALIAKTADGYVIAADEGGTATPCVETEGEANICVMKTAYVLRTSTLGDPETVTAGENSAARTVTAPTAEADVAYNYYLGSEANFHVTPEVAGTDPTVGRKNTPTSIDEGSAAEFGDAPEPTMEVEPGHRASHISAEFGLGAITAALGYSEKKMNDEVNKTKTTFIGVKGSLGDTGLNWGAYSRVKKMADGTESKPWTIGLNKSLGGGATTYIEHGNDGNDGSTVVALRVDF